MNFETNIKPDPIAEAPVKGVPHLKEFCDLQRELMGVWGVRETVIEQNGIDPDEHKSLPVAWVKSGMASRFAVFQKTNPDYDFSSVTEAELHRILAEVAAIELSTE